MCNYSFEVNKDSLAMATSVTATATLTAQATDLRRDEDFSTEDVVRLLELTEQVKRTPARFAHALSGRYLALLFEKPSLRTRLTFELAIKQLGGDSVVSTGPVNHREPVKDVARNLARWMQGIVARTFSQATIDELAHWSQVPVINALSDLYHPCQAFADVFTLKERFSRLRGLKLAFCGDGNNVAHSLMLECSRLGVDFALATPPGYEADGAVVAQARRYAAETGAAVTITYDAQEAVESAHAVYTDVWASMGEEDEAEERRRNFASYQVDESLMSMAREDAIFLHCLPAKRGEEVTDGVIESSQSAVFDQAENRLHAQKALLLMLLS
jgi:ornithine carbamoyltransferase